MTRRAEIHREDPELGHERRCKDCGEWWPMDDEFWYFQTRVGVRGLSRTAYPYCKACWSVRGRGRVGVSA